MRTSEDIRVAETEEGLGDLMSRLVADARAYATAEAAFLQETATSRVKAARGGAIMLVAALLFVSAAVTALIVGLLMTAAEQVGPAWGTLIVVVVTLLIAGLLGWLGARKFSNGLAGKS
jgi:lysozyme family protein